MTKTFTRPEKARRKNRRPGKKAQAETQLNWIFIMIVGVVILAFFAFIVIKQKSASEAKFAGKVSQQLNTILVGAKVSSGTVQEIPTPDLEIRFTCNDYYIGPASQRLGNRILFAPENLKGNKLITWTRDWNVPYKVTSFLYMTTPFVRYVIVGKTADDRGAMEIFNTLPDKLNKDFTTIDEYNAGALRDAGDDYVRFIFVDVGSSFNAPSGFDDVEMSGLSVDTVAKRVQFLEQSGAALITSGPVHTYTEPSVLFGAVFSDKAEDYACLMRRAYARFNIVTMVYYAKLNAIAPVYERTNCEGFYKDNQDLQAVIDATSVYPPDYGIIGSMKSKLKETNQRLQLQSCPLIY